MTPKKLTRLEECELMLEEIDEELQWLQEHERHDRECFD